MSSSLLLSALITNFKLYPYVATLAIGDVLFIPSMWDYTVTANEDVGAAINVFRKGLGEKAYAVGRYVYDNCDLKGYKER